MNPNLRDIVKEEILKLLEARFIYPISDSEWVSPLVIVTNKNEKWRVCVDYRELNKVTQKDHFCFRFIDQGLDTLFGKKFFPFWVGLVGTTRSRLLPKTKIRPPSPVPQVLFHIGYFPSVCAMHLPPFREL